MVSCGDQVRSRGIILDGIVQKHGIAATFAAIFLGEILSAESIKACLIQPCDLFRGSAHYHACVSL